MPFVTPPFGMTDWTPQTRQNKLSVVSYNYDDTTISGFMGTHQPAIWMGDYGYVTVMPEVDSLRSRPRSANFPSRHGRRSRAPGLLLRLAGRRAVRPLLREMTATERCAFMRFTFPAPQNPLVIVEASRPGIAGFAQSICAHARSLAITQHRTDANLGPLRCPTSKATSSSSSAQAFTSSGTYGLDDGITAECARGAYAQFHTAGQSIEVRVGTSFLSIEQARANLEHEIPALGLRCRARRSPREVERETYRVSARAGHGRNSDAVVYTALYHALLYPRVFSEYGHYYSAFDDTIHSGESLHRVLDLGYFSRRVQPADAARSRARRWHDHMRCCRTTRKAAGCPSGPTPPTPTS